MTRTPEAQAAWNAQRRASRDDDVRARERVAKREYNQRRKREVIEHYGGVCHCCGESDLTFLTLDHKDGDGAAHRRRVFGHTRGYRGPRGQDSSGTFTYQWAIRSGFPPIFIVSCFNCNFGRHVNGGVCPHKEA